MKFNFQPAGGDVQKMLMIVFCFCFVVVQNWRTRCYIEFLMSTFWVFLLHLEKVYIFFQDACRFLVIYCIFIY